MGKASDAMSQVQLQFLGSGDAFGSGGRFQACFLLSGVDGHVLIDCGASSLIAMKRIGVDPSEIGWVLVSHLHMDHFGGVPYLILDGQINRRTRTLVIAGPPGLQKRLQAAMEGGFPGSTQIVRRFTTDVLELPERRASQVGPALVTPFVFDHASGAPSYALRVEYSGKVIAYSGDTAWTEVLVEVARGADLFVCEAYFFDKNIKYHLNYQTLRQHRARLDCRQVILTHMSQDMLSHLSEVEFQCADDGKIIVL
jgi:ribonuclease BN (tRNA processing enzyme)